MRELFTDKDESNLNGYGKQDLSDDKKRKGEDTLAYWRTDVENRIFRDLLGIKSRECT